MIKKIILLLMITVLTSCSQVSQPPETTKVPEVIESEKEAEVLTAQILDKGLTNNDVEINDKFNLFVENLMKSEYEKTADEAAYECTFDGFISNSKHYLSYNESCFVNDGFINFANRSGDSETYYNVDSDSELANEFKSLVEAITK